MSDEVEITSESALEKIQEIQTRMASASALEKPKLYREMHEEIKVLVEKLEASLKDPEEPMILKFIATRIIGIYEEVLKPILEQVEKDLH